MANHLPEPVPEQFFHRYELVSLLTHEREARRGLLHRVCSATALWALWAWGHAPPGGASTATP